MVSVLAWLRGCLLTILLGCSGHVHQLLMIAQALPSCITLKLLTAVGKLSSALQPQLQPQLMLPFDPRYRPLSPLTTRSLQVGATLPVLHVPEAPRCPSNFIASPRSPPFFPPAACKSEPRCLFYTYLGYPLGELPDSGSLFTSCNDPKANDPFMAPNCLLWSGEQTAAIYF